VFRSSRSRRQPAADPRAAERAVIEDRFARGEQIELRSRPIDFSPRGRLLGFMIPLILPMLVLLAVAFGFGALAGAVPFIESNRAPLALAALAVGLVPAVMANRVYLRTYRRSLAGRSQPSALLSSRGMEQVLGAEGGQIPGADRQLAQHGQLGRDAEPMSRP
jgi:hypothetical protein